MRPSARGEADCWASCGPERHWRGWPRLKLKIAQDCCAASFDGNWELGSRTQCGRTKLFTRLESGTLDHFDFGACGSGDVGEVDRRTVRERQRTRLGQYRYALRPQAVDHFGQRARGAPTDVIDCVVLARFGVASLGQNPHRAKPRHAVLNTIDPALHFRALSAVLRQKPGEN